VGDFELGPAIGAYSGPSILGRGWETGRVAVGDELYSRQPRRDQRNHGVAIGVKLRLQILRESMILSIYEIETLLRGGAMMGVDYQSSQLGCRQHAV
jgi:hypothetical protein